MRKTKAARDAAEKRKSSLEGRLEDLEQEVSRIFFEIIEDIFFTHGLTAQLARPAGRQHCRDEDEHRVDLQRAQGEAARS
jgi:hypothetical protein